MPTDKPAQVLTNPTQVPFNLAETATPTGLVGVFDSGVGGLSVLGAIHRQAPALPLLYLADSGHAPYGDRDAQHVLQRSAWAAKHLRDAGASVIVVACNTATAWAIDALREWHPEMRFVGVEPGIKPASQSTRNGRIAVMATPSTLRSARFASLLERHAQDVTVSGIACQGLAAAIERGLEHPELDVLLDRYCAQATQTGADTVVLGCTHYPFVADKIQARLGPDVTLVDTAEAVARQVLSRLPADRAAQTPRSELATNTPQLQSTGDPEVLHRLAQAAFAASPPIQHIKS